MRSEQRMKSEQGTQPTIFLIEEDDQTRQVLVRNLRGEGYRVIVAIDEDDALGRIEGGQAPVDLVLINLVRKSADECLRVGRRVREHMNHNGHTPLVVMPEKYGKDVEG